MRVLLISAYDWAHVGDSLAKCLKAADVEAKAISLMEHPLLPDNNLVPVKEVAEWEDWADVVIAMHSEPVKLGKPTFVFHGGSRYRNDHKELNKFWNGNALASFIQTQDLFGLGAENEIELPAPVDTGLVHMHGRSEGDTKFGHFPSNALKGSDVVNYAFYKVSTRHPVDYVYDPNRTEWKDHIGRMANVDVVIESCGVGAGWGVNGAEAAALGRIVIGRLTRQEEYEEEFGPCEMVVANDYHELRGKIESLFYLSRKEIKEKQMATREWIDKYHSFKATGTRMKRIMEGLI